MKHKKSTDHDETLIACLRSFWQKGFAGTSLDDLRALTNPDTALSEANVKSDLYLRCLASYFERRGARATLTRKPLGFRNIRAFLRLGEIAIQGHRGCFMVNSMRELHALPDAARESIGEKIAFLTELLRQNIEAERPESDATMMADLTLTFFSGVCIEQNTEVKKVTTRKVRRFMRLLKTL